MPPDLRPTGEPIHFPEAPDNLFRSSLLKPVEILSPEPPFRSFNLFSTPFGLFRVGQIPFIFNGIHHSVV
jgi:hypothetical protein